MHWEQKKKVSKPSSNVKLNLTQQLWNQNHLFSTFLEPVTPFTPARAISYTQAISERLTLHKTHPDLGSPSLPEEQRLFSQGPAQLLTSVVFVNAVRAGTN